MVLEKLLSLRSALRNPLMVMIVGGVVSVACLIVSLLVFKDSIGMFTTFLITIAMSPFMVNLLRYEEASTEEQIAEHDDMNILQRHADMLQVYSAFFIGMILALSLIYILLPSDFVESVFQDQIEEIKIIRGGFMNLGVYEKIVVNNLSVLLISFLFSFLFGAGAVFILAWNASVLATAIGLAAKTIGGMKGFPMAVMIFFPHGSLEILAYFIGAIAGGIVSAAVTRDRSKQFWPVIEDSTVFLIVAVVLIFVAGFIEALQL